MAAQQRTFNELVDYLNTFANNHLQVKNFAVGFRSEINTIMTEDNEYPFLFVEPLSHIINNQIQTYTTRIYCMDIKQKDGSNQTDVLSDTLQILNDLYKYIINDSTDNYNVVNIPQAIPNTNYGVEFCVGWYFDIQIQVIINDSDCDIPFA